MSVLLVEQKEMLGMIPQQSEAPDQLVVRAASKHANARRGAVRIGSGREPTKNHAPIERSERIRPNIDT